MSELLDKGHQDELVKGIIEKFDTHLNGIRYEAKEAMGNFSYKTERSVSSFLNGVEQKFNRFVFDKDLNSYVSTFFDRVRKDLPDLILMLKK